MSLILEALKKSEAERRLGRAPDLLAPAPPRRPPARGWRPGVVIALAAVALLAGLAGWWFARPIAPNVPPEVQTSAPAHMPAAASAEATPRSEPAVSAARRTAPPSASEAAEVIANVPVPQDPDFAGTERESVAMPAAAIPLARPAPRPSTVAPALPHPPAATPPVPPQTASKAPRASGAAAPVPAAPAATAPALDPIPSLATLPASEREGWPPLRLSMHVYDPDPTARIALIDGKRYREGDAIAPDLVVDMIRPDGVALSYHGRRFLLPRR